MSMQETWQHDFHGGCCIEGRDPGWWDEVINEELEAYNPEIAKRPQVIAKQQGIEIWEGTK